MVRFRSIVPALCVIILAAHFLREQQTVPVLFSLFVLLPFLFIKTRWSVMLLRVFFLAAGLEWIRTTMALVMERTAMGLPWMRMVAILGLVTALTLGSTLIVKGGKSDRPVSS